jgi:hypothetical protein
VKVITTIIPVNRLARQLEGNIGKYARGKHNSPVEMWRDQSMGLVSVTSVKFTQHQLKMGMWEPKKHHKN